MPGGRRENSTRDEITIITRRGHNYTLRFQFRDATEVRPDRGNFPLGGEDRIPIAPLQNALRLRSSASLNASLGEISSAGREGNQAPTGSPPADVQLPLCA